MGAAGNKKPKKPKDKHHVPAYEMAEAMNEANKKPRNQKKKGAFSLPLHHGKRCKGIL